MAKHFAYDDQLSWPAQEAPVSAPIQVALEEEWAACTHCGGRGDATGAGPGTGWDEEPCHGGPYG